MVEEVPTRHCLVCNKPVRGRTDKKFCNDYCRNIFNNQAKAPVNNFVRNINNALGKNRKILDKFLSHRDSIAKVSKETLFQNGFQFKYFTHCYINRKGSVYKFCYDFGYLELENDYCLVVKNYKD